MAGILKSAGVLAVLVLAGLGCLFVLDVLPREMFQELFTKSLAVIAILGAAGLVVALLIRKPGA
jgi:hypothetical protein